MPIEVIVNEGEAHEGSAPNPPSNETPASISVEALRLIEESAALRAGLELFRAEIAGLAARLDAHEESNRADFAELHALIDGLEIAAEHAEDLAEVAADLATEAAAGLVTEAVEENRPAEELPTHEGDDLGGEVPESVAEAEAAEPTPSIENPAERRRLRGFIRI
jgi:hypothetical protein